MKFKYYWIKERHNPQLGVYYVTYGQISMREAKSNEKSIYGSNVMHKYETEDEYDIAIAELRQRGERIHEN